MNTPFNASDFPSSVSTSQLVFSDAGALEVGRLARWMKVAAAGHYFLAAFITVAAFFVGAAMGDTGGWVILMLVINALAVILALYAGRWLWEAADHFVQGVVHEAPGVLGRGFGSLRAYWILIGILGLIPFVFAGAVFALELFS